MALEEGSRSQGRASLRAFFVADCGGQGSAGSGDGIPKNDETADH